MKQRLINLFFKYLVNKSHDKIICDKTPHKIRK